MRSNEKELVHCYVTMETVPKNLLRYTCPWKDEGSTGTGEAPSLFLWPVRLHDLRQKRSLSTNGIRG